MDAFNSVLQTILDVFAAIKEFFANLMDMFKKEEGDETTAA